MTREQQLERALRIIWGYTEDNNILEVIDAAIVAPQSAEPTARIAPAVSEGWRPIETAPTDGTEILLLQWRGNWGDSDMEPGCFQFIEVSDSDGRDIYDWCTNRGWIKEPTHWRTSLPEPPLAASPEYKP